MACSAIAVAYVRHSHPEALFFGDSSVFAAAGDLISRGENPYLAPMIAFGEHGLPFMSPPPTALFFGAMSGVFGEFLFWMLLALHFIALAVAPMIQARLFIGRDTPDLAFAYGAFFCGLGAFGVTTLVSGNFGASMHFAIIAGMAYAVRTGTWGWFHAAVALSCLVKPPYAAFWIVPMLWNGRDWRQFRLAVVAGVLVTAAYVASYLADPQYFRDWLASVERQIAGTGDYGLSLYGTLAWHMNFDEGRDSIVPHAAHLALSTALLGFVLLDKSRGMKKLAALVTLAILVNPRMKQYDAAFAAIPVAALLIGAIAPQGSVARRRILAMLATALLFVATIYLDRLPIIGSHIYVIVMSGAILTLALRRHPVQAAQP